MGSVLPFDAVRVYQAEINFVYKSRSLKGMSGLLGCHIPARHAMKLVVNDRHKAVQGSVIASPPGL